MEAIKGSSFFGGKSSSSGKKSSNPTSASKKKLPTSSITSTTLPSTSNNPSDNNISPHRSSASTSSSSNFEFHRVSSSNTSVSARKGRSLISQMSPQSRAKQFGQLDALAAAALGNTSQFTAQNIQSPSGGGSTGGILSGGSNTGASDGYPSSDDNANTPAPHPASNANRIPSHSRPYVKGNSLATGSIPTGTNNAPGSRRQSYPVGQSTTHGGSSADDDEAIIVQAVSSKLSLGSRSPVDFLTGGSHHQAQPPPPPPSSGGGEGMYLSGRLLQQQQQQQQRYTTSSHGQHPPPPPPPPSNPSVGGSSHSSRRFQLLPTMESSSTGGRILIENGTYHSNSSSASSSTTRSSGGDDDEDEFEDSVSTYSDAEEDEDQQQQQRHKSRWGGGGSSSGGGGGSAVMSRSREAMVASMKNAIAAQQQQQGYNNGNKGRDSRGHHHHHPGDVASPNSSYFDSSESPKKKQQGGGGGGQQQRRTKRGDKKGGLLGPFLGGPSFDSFHHWSQYLHFLVYQKGVPRQKHTINFYDEDGNGVSYEGYSYKPPDISKWDKNKSHWHRSGRFPSVEQRIKFYMDRWYDVKAPNLFRDFRSKAETLNYTSKTYMDNNNLIIDPLGLDPKSIFDYCLIEPDENITESRRVKMLYARDMIDMAILNGNSTIPVIVHFGDRTSHANEIVDISYPVFGKVRNLERSVISNNCANNSTDCQSKTHHVSIIWPMNRGRHLKPASFVPKDDRPWKQKKRKLIWRGGGFGIKDVESLNSESIEDSSWKQRFDLVNNHVNSSLIDAKFTGKKQLASAIHGKRMSKHELLRYRYILSIEGNDVSSGLKWMLFSNSVVFLPPIKYVSWAMESFLEPFVHFIPVHANLSNLEEMVQWAEDHEMEARQIAERSTLFIYDLLFHPDAYRDEELILSGIMKRYKENFGPIIK